MSLLSSHRLHWGSHHELTDHFWVIIDRMIHPASGETPAPPEAANREAHPFLTPGVTPAQSTASQPEVLGP